MDVKLLDQFKDLKEQVTIVKELLSTSTPEKYFSFSSDLSDDNPTNNKFENSEESEVSASKISLVKSPIVQGKTNKRNVTTRIQANGEKKQPLFIMNDTDENNDFDDSSSEISLFLAQQNSKVDILLKQMGDSNEETRKKLEISNSSSYLNVSSTVSDNDQTLIEEEDEHSNYSDSDSEDIKDILRKITEKIRNKKDIVPHSNDYRRRQVEKALKLLNNSSDSDSSDDSDSDAELYQLKKNNIQNSSNDSTMTSLSLHNIQNKTDDNNENKNSNIPTNLTYSNEISIEDISSDSDDLPFFVPPVPYNLSDIESNNYPGSISLDEKPALVYDPDLKNSTFPSSILNSSLKFKSILNIDENNNTMENTQLSEDSDITLVYYPKSSSLESIKKEKLKIDQKDDNEENDSQMHFYKELFSNIFNSSSGDRLDSDFESDTLSNFS